MERVEVGEELDDVGSKGLKELGVSLREGYDVRVTYPHVPMACMHHQTGTYRQGQISEACLVQRPSLTDLVRRVLDEIYPIRLKGLVDRDAEDASARDDEAVDSFASIEHHIITCPHQPRPDLLVGDLITVWTRGYPGELDSALAQYLEPFLLAERVGDEALDTLIDPTDHLSKWLFLRASVGV